MVYMKNDELISKLIEETCNEEEAPAAKAVESLSDYFDRKVNQVEFLSLSKYITQQGLESSKLSYNAETKCYRLEIKEMKLDFPSNWSVFEGLNQNNFAYINRENDHDFLCDIFSEIHKECESFILIQDHDDCNLITFSDYSGKLHSDWIKNYFEKKKEKEEYQKAA